MSTDIDLSESGPLSEGPEPDTIAWPADLEQSAAVAEQRRARCRQLTVRSEGQMPGRWTEIQASYVEDVQGVESVIQEITAILLESYEEVDKDRSRLGGRDCDLEQLRAALRANCSHTDIALPRPGYGLARSGSRFWTIHHALAMRLTRLVRCGAGGRRPG